MLEKVVLWVFVGVLAWCVLMLVVLVVARSFLIPKRPAEGSTGARDKGGEQEEG